MNGIRCALVNRQGVVQACFMASPENDAVNSKLIDGDGNSCVVHPAALPGDTIINGVWTQSQANLQLTTAPDPVVVAQPT